MSKILPEPHPDCEWVFNGEGVATRKYDGTCCKIDGGVYYKRREVKRGKIPPVGFVEEDYDPVTGKRVGWVLVSPMSTEDKYHREAHRPYLEDGTYELCGPKVQGNAENFPEHILIKHSDCTVFEECPREYEALKGWLRTSPGEGIVWHHPDGRMAKIKKRDFGIKRLAE